MSTVDHMTHVEFYDLLNGLDWNNWQVVEKARKVGQLSLEHKIVFIQFENYIKGNVNKPERPRI